MAYGHSEQVIGEYMSQASKPFDIITKILAGSEGLGPKSIKTKIQNSLIKLNSPHVYGCLVHSFEEYRKAEFLWSVLEDFKREGVIEKIGFSLYKPEELDLLWVNGVEFDIVQLPFSVLDRRFERYFRLLKERNIEIHTRSVFLQGLVFMDPKQLPESLQQASESLHRLQDIAQKNQISVSALCLNYVGLNRHIDKVVIGVDSLSHLRSNISDLKEIEKVSRLMQDLETLNISSEDVLLPYNWKLSPL
jgi:aryl-alcohol dehydrogenase-like predicted oxidoreductase